MHNLLNQFLRALSIADSASEVSELRIDPDEVYALVRKPSGVIQKVLVRDWRSIPLPDPSVTRTASGRAPKHAADLPDEIF